VKLDRIGVNDIVEVCVRGRLILGRVTEIKDGVVYFNPICPGVGWRHAKAREVIAHWRKTGRRSGGKEGELDPPAAIDGQLSLADGPRAGAESK
jgi:hypothetical protein